MSNQRSPQEARDAEDLRDPNERVWMRKAGIEGTAGPVPHHSFVNLYSNEGWTEVEAPNEDHRYDPVPSDTGGGTTPAPGGAAVPGTPTDPAGGVTAEPVVLGGAATAASAPPASDKAPKTK